MDKGLQQYAEDFRDLIDGIADGKGDDSSINVFTETTLDYLRDSGEIGDAQVCNYRRTGTQLNGFCITHDEVSMSVDLIVALQTQIVPPILIRKNDWEPAIKRAVGFLKKSLEGLYRALTKDTEVYEIAKQIFDNKDKIRSARIIFLTDGITKHLNIDDEKIEGIELDFQVWDIERLFRLLSSGRKRETIFIDFEQRFGNSIPCLSMPKENEDYETYLAIISGDLLADLYGEFGERLIERNVRSFLQAKGIVNKGIKETIVKTPHMFLAYNNGISATAEKVGIVKNEDGTSAIKTVKDLQIVNGGQTTASIFHVRQKDKDANLHDVYVQLKLTVIKDETKMEQIVPLISVCANSQNKIQNADFYANDPFHRSIEQLSRTIWAPAADGKHRQTKWFYERARGQYLDLKSRETTPGQKKIFDETYPKSQLFTKTDLAKYSNTWAQLPHIVSRGSQKNFIEFTKHIEEFGPFEPDQSYFQDLIAKAILFNRTTQLVPFKYRANIVTYTVAWLSYKTQQQIDLSGIWRKQELSSLLEDTILKVSRAAHAHITSPPGGQNITEWCKKEECWIKFRDLDIEEFLELRAESLQI